MEAFRRGCLYFCAKNLHISEFFAYFAGRNVITKQYAT